MRELSVNEYRMRQKRCQREIEIIVITNAKINPFGHYNDQNDQLYTRIYNFKLILHPASY